MKKITSAAISAVMLGSLIAGSVAQAAPRYSNRDREMYVSKYCGNHRGDRDCRDFTNNHGRWDDRRYNSWYRNHRGNDNAAAAIFGLATGAIVGAAVAGSNVVQGDDHEYRCAQQYRSYDPNTDTYVVNRAGDRARCRL